LQSTVAIPMLSTAANAADLDMAPASEPMPAYDCTGFYIGAAAGWLGGKSKSRLEFLADGEIIEEALARSWGRKY
jgi:hypothetical protein